ncbi:MAG: hypothetical protein R3Y46_07385 [Opitutales bacterium]
MIMHIYDIGTKPKRTRIDINVERDDMEIALSIEEKAYSNLLIIPPKESNKKAYTQDFKQASIEDFYIDGKFSYPNTFSLSEILSKLEKDDSFLKLKDYFNYQEADNKLNADKNIILVPDSYSALTQEYLLSIDSFKREKTSLLWRSVAACLGANLKDAKAEDKLLVIDSLNDEILATILILKEDTRNGKTLLVPQRKAYKRHTYFYPYMKSILEQNSALPIEVDSFFRHTFYGTKNKTFIAPFKDTWREFDTPKDDNICITQLDLSGIDHCIIIGDTKLPNGIVAKQTSLEEGVAKFAYYREKGYPTYLDQCEELSIIVQNPKEESIDTYILIPAKDDCVGGEEIQGKINEKTSIEKQNKMAQFLLKLGDTMELKELSQEFPESTKDQSLTLIPAMIPGQGIARVKVEAYPLIKEAVMLDFLNMKDSEKTIESLQNEIKRSFPIEIPQVKVNPKSWNEILKNKINIFLNTEEINPDIFSKSKYENQNAVGIERFQRLNVFAKEGEIPKEFEELVNHLFLKLKKYYNKSPKDAMRIAAWTYDYKNLGYFDKIKEDILEAFENGERMPKQAHTFCGNCLKNNVDLIRYYNAFVQNLFERISTAKFNINDSYPKKIEGLSDWLRGFSELLVNNNEFFAMFENEEYKTLIKYTPIDCAEFLLYVYVSYMRHNDIAAIRSLLKTMLFLLKYRKYNKDFLRNTDPFQMNLYELILEKTDPKRIDRRRTSKQKEDIRTLVTSYRDFLQGNGSLEGIPNLNTD